MTEFHLLVEFSCSTVKAVIPAFPTVLSQNAVNRMPLKHINKQKSLSYYFFAQLNGYSKLVHSC